MSIAEKLQAVAENQQKVYDAGFTAGQAAGGDTDAAFQEGFDAGKQAEYDTFWDAFQQNGNRTDYRCSFGGWTEQMFKPKYDIRPTIGTDYMFAYSFVDGIDLVKVLEECGVVLDTSQAAGFNYFVYCSGMSHLPVLDTRNALWATNLAYNSSVETIDKIILREDGSQIVSSMITACPYLKNLVIEGVIGNDMDISGSWQLTKASIESIINALSDTVSGKILQISKRAVNNAFTTDEWNALRATKPNWTITLA